MLRRTKTEKLPPRATYVGLRSPTSREIVDAYLTVVMALLQHLIQDGAEACAQVIAESARSVILKVLHEPQPGVATSRLY